MTAGVGLHVCVISLHALCLNIIILMEVEVSRVLMREKTTSAPM